MLLTIIGASARAGFPAPPLTGPPSSTPAASANPIAIAALPEPIFESDVVAATVSTRIKPMRPSLQNTCRSLEPCAGAVAPSCTLAIAL